MVKFGLLGAEGQIGKAVLDKALASKGHQAYALVKHAKDIEPRAGLTVIEGSYSHGPDILRLVKGGDATADRASNEMDVVIVALSDVQMPGRGELVTPALISLYVAKPKRIIVVTANGCDAPLLSTLKRSAAPCYYGRHGQHGEYCTLADLTQADRLVTHSRGRTGWLLIRPNNVQSEERSRATWRYEVTAKPGLRRAGICSRDVGQFIFDHLASDKWDYCPVHLHKGNKDEFDGPVKMVGGFMGARKIEAEEFEG